jgi:quinol monooxygenase YgiN
MSPRSAPRRSAATFLVLLAVACAQATRGSSATHPASSQGASTVNTAATAASGHAPGMMVRISEIQVAPDRLQEYVAILTEEAEASVRLEPGVIAIFPMYQRENPTEVRILEIYASRAAYESHIKSPHFERYKSTTLPMVRSLNLVDMEAMDATTMATIFEKMKRDR